MKRDFKKWLDKKYEEQELAEADDYWDTLEAWKSSIFDKHVEDGLSDYEAFVRTEQAFWMEAQKQFLKDILDDIDIQIERVFRGNNTVKYSKAQAVAYEESIKHWLKSKYHYLKRKNGV